MNFFSGIFRWIYSKVLMLLLLIGILTLLNFVWYGLTPLWIFLKHGDQQYEERKNELEAQIAQVRLFTFLRIFFNLRRVVIMEKVKNFACIKVFLTNS